MDQFFGWLGGVDWEHVYNSSRGNARVMDINGCHILARIEFNEGFEINEGFDNSQDEDCSMNGNTSVSNFGDRQTPDQQFGHDQEARFQGFQPQVTHQASQLQDQDYQHLPEMNPHDHQDLLSTNNNNGGQQLNNPNVLPYSTASPYENLHLVANEVNNLNALYENRQDFRAFHQGQIQGQEQLVEPRYPSPTAPINNHPYIQQEQQQDQEQDQAQQQQQDATPNGRMDVHIEPKSESDATSPGRSKPIAKPERPVTKNDAGLFECDWEECNEDVRTFVRKCEWSKHMDKHDRPYKCPAPGCEKLPGFTYSGGLLRHEREVHGKHGGPRKQLNCPHQNCKRATGKGFSRQENLNEHLRRVHTSGPNGLPLANVGPQPNGTGSEDVKEEVQVGQKRKRGLEDDDEDDIRKEIKDLREENNELRAELQRTRMEHENIQADMQRQLHHLQAAMHLPNRLQQAPPANMV